MNSKRLAIASAALAGTMAHGQFQSGPLVTSNQPLDPLTEKTLVIRDPVALGQVTLARVLEQIILTTPRNATPAGTGASPTVTLAQLDALLQSLPNDYKKNQDTNPVSGTVEAISPRPEGDLKPTDLRNPSHPDGLHLTALVNRLDQASGNFLGQQRLIFTDQFTQKALILEAAITKPTGESGLALKEHWDSMKTAEGPALRDKIDQLLFRGVGNIGPAISFANLASPAAAIRPVTIMPGVGWQARQFTLTTDQAGNPVMKGVPADDVPRRELWGDAVSGEPPEIRALRTDHQAVFLNTRIPQLMPLDLLPSSRSAMRQQPTDIQLLHRHLNSNTTPARFNSFVSNMDGSENLQFTISPVFRASITSAMPTNTRWPVSPSEIIARATAAQCSGCHGGSGGSTIAPSTSFPFAGFTHFNSSFVTAAPDGTIIAGEPARMSNYMDKILPERKRLIDAWAVMAQGSPPVEAPVGAPVQAAALVQAPAVETANVSRELLKPAKTVVEYAKNREILRAKGVSLH